MKESELKMKSLAKVKYVKFTAIGMTAGILVGVIIFWLFRAVKDEPVEFID